jgi:nucleosome binding factor SPN SPT16 subunit
VKPAADDDILKGRGMRNSAFTSAKRDHDTAENRRKQHQDKLHDELNREAKERLLENKGKEETKTKRKTNYSYKSGSQFPQESDIRDLRNTFKTNKCFFQV